jgi:hypothetical protein
MRKYALAAVALLVSIVSPLAAASQGAQVAINGRVRTVCTVDLAFETLPHLRAGLNQLGAMVELCNNVEGYRLILDHPAGLAGAAILLDGRRIEIEPSSTRTVIVDSSRPAYEQRQLGLELAAPTDIGQMRIYAEPKGAVF